MRAGTVITPRGEFNIVIAGLAAGAQPELGPLAAAYVLIMAVAGPVVARVGEPVAALALRRRRARRPAAPDEAERS